MPLSYPEGTLAEHRACRHGAVAFDVSHLGTVRVTGPGALERLQWALTNDLGRIEPGRAQYTHLLDEADASVLDDIIVWWVDDRALRRDAQRVEHRPGDRRAARPTACRCTTSPRPGRSSPCRGPRPGRGWPPSAPRRRPSPRFHVAQVEWHGAPVVVAGTGYTGEDGVECAVPAEPAGRLWSAVLGRRRRARRPRRPRHAAARGRPAAARPRARSGHHPAAGRAGLGRALGQGRLPGPRRRSRPRRSGGSPGACAAWSSRAGGRRGPSRPCCGDGEAVGVVTSGNFSPELGHGIALAFVPPDVEIGDSWPSTSAAPDAGRGGQAPLRRQVLRLPRPAESGWQERPQTTEQMPSFRRGVEGQALLMASLMAVWPASAVRSSSAAGIAGWRYRPGTGDNGLTDGSPGVVTSVDSCRTRCGRRRRRRCGPPAGSTCRPVEPGTGKAPSWRG